jgi:hypothetical protein
MDELRTFPSNPPDVITIFEFSTESTIKTFFVHILKRKNVELVCLWVQNCPPFSLPILPTSSFFRRTAKK